MSEVLMGQMMQMPLLISSLVTHAARHHADSEIVSKRVEGDLHRTNYREVETRSRQLAQALMRLGCGPGDRIATLAFNGYRHLEIYYATSGMGSICHTVNPRLFPEQIAWIINDAQDRVLCFDLTFVPLVEKLAPHLPTSMRYVLMTDRAHMPTTTTLPDLLCYESLVQAEDGAFSWPLLDENTASSLCYTSGTTGHPKGALYSHRSSVLHAFASVMPDAMGLSSTDSVLPVVPMFHVNAWGLPYSCAMTGARVVFPGPHLDGKSLYELFEGERVTFSAGVPTVWLGVINHMQATQQKLTTLKRTVIGGAACPPAMMQVLRETFGVDVIHAWGMTELSPLGSLSRLKGKHLTWPPEQQQRLLQKQGRAVFGIDLAIVDDHGQAQPWDGNATGDLLVRGHWVIDRYFGAETSPLVPLAGEAWFPTGDVASIDEDGFMNITDRSKDVIKSGGEWISSIELENIAMAHPSVLEAAVIAVRHPKWDERPLLIVKAKPDHELSREMMLAFYDGKIAKWQVPDDVVFVDEIPHTATGKVQKLKLREQFQHHTLPDTPLSAR